MNLADDNVKGTGPMAETAGSEEGQDLPTILTPRFANHEIGAAEIMRRVHQDRLITQAMGGLFVEYPDLAEARRVLDIHCGPGGWVHDVAFAYPEIEAVGIDQSSNMITYACTQANIQHLPNVSFYQVKQRTRLDFEDDTFDAVNARFLSLRLAQEEWPQLMRECVRVSRPGGIIRLTDSDVMGISTSAALTQMNRLYSQAITHTGRGFFPLPQSDHLCITPQLSYFLERAGCLDVSERPFALNFSVGKPAYHDTYANIRVAYKLCQSSLIKTGIATQQEVDELYEQMMMEMLSDDFRAIWYFLAAWGYKPA